MPRRTPGPVPCTLASAGGSPIPSVSHIYEYCGVVLSSTRALDELRPGSSAEADIEIDWQAPRPLDAHPDVPRARLDAPEEDEFFALTEVGDERSLWFEGVACFRLRTAPSRLQCTPVPGCTQATLTHILLDQVLPRLLTGRGDLVLHASAVEIDGMAVAFLGPSGRGKSTLAGALDRAGHPCLSDDVVRICRVGDDLQTYGSYPGLRLFPGHAERLLEDRTSAGRVATYTDKERFACAPQDGVRAGARRLVRWYVLEEAPPGAGVSLQALSRRDALIASMAHAFHLDPGGAEVHRRDLEHRALSPLLSCGATLSYPRDLASLPAVIACVVADVRARFGAGAAPTDTSAEGAGR